MLVKMKQRMDESSVNWMKKKLYKKYIELSFVCIQIGYRSKKNPRKKKQNYFAKKYEWKNVGLKSIVESEILDSLFIGKREYVETEI